MDNEFEETRNDILINNNEQTKDDYFLNNLNSTLGVKRDYEKMEYDHEWLETIEDAIPYIDNILRNPKRFIINEEEIVKVELAKRVTVESVIHLSQHTSLIQDIDKKTGDVKPSKILNINRDESLDTYENRFIFTLINNLELFFNERITESGDSSYYIDKKDLSYEANTKVGTENINISLTIHSLDKDVDEMVNSSGMTYQDRVRKIKMQIDGFHGTELYQTLTHLHVSPVRSPIRKTNVILKNPNFQKAESLWNYINSFVSKDKKEYQKLDYFDNSDIKNEYDHAVLLAYIANKTLGEERELSERKVITEMIQRLIENILDTDVEMTEDKLKNLFDKQIQNIKERNIEKAKNIFSILEDRLQREKKRMEDQILILRNEG